MASMAAMNIASNDSATRYEQARQQELARLVLHFHGSLRAQLKPLAAAIGVAAQTVRNNGNKLKINGREIRPSSVCGRVTYALDEVASALALGAVQAPPPARLVTRRERAPAASKGRAKKVDLAEQIPAGGQR